MRSMAGIRTLHLDHQQPVLRDGQLPSAWQQRRGIRVLDDRRPRQPRAGRQVRAPVDRAVDQAGLRELYLPL